MKATVIETTKNGFLTCPKTGKRIKDNYCGENCKYCRMVMVNGVKCVWEQSQDVHNNICIPGKPAPKHYNQEVEI